MSMHPTPLQSRCLRKLATVTALVASATAWAHDGHGMEGSHWHATDIWGLLAVAAAALYYLRRK